MSDDPETARQIAELARDDRPLLVLDVDEVVLEFVTPLENYLGAHELAFAETRFALSGNIVHRQTGEMIDDVKIQALLDTFFDVQGDWQTLAPGAIEAIASLARRAEIVLLTAMPHPYRAQRRALFDKLGMAYPLLTTERAKGPAVKALRGGAGRPVAFVDDMLHNHHSVRQFVPDAALFHIMAHAGIRATMRDFDEGIVPVQSWADAAPKIAAALGFSL